MNDDLDGVEELSQTTITREHIEGRVRDWENRLRDLFRQVRAWAVENGWRVDDSRVVEMHEDLMQQYGVPAATQPTPRLDDEHSYALFEPRGLWVIGANGRIDLYTSKGVFVIVDLAEPDNAPQWTIFRPSQGRAGEPFRPEMIANLV